MSTILLNAAIAIVAILLILGIWGSVHLLAQKRLGDRKLGCSGPTMDESGNQVCCNTGETCEKECPDSPK